MPAARSRAAVSHASTVLNVRVAAPGRWATDPVIATAAAQAEQRLGTRGRLLIRASGTEPLVRVMVEHEDAATAELTARELCDLIGRRLGGTESAAVPEEETAGGGP